MVYANKVNSMEEKNINIREAFDENVVPILRRVRADLEHSLGYLRANNCKKFRSRNKVVVNKM